MGYQIIEPSAGSTDWTDFSVMVNDTMQGFISLSLTNYDTTDVPLIAAGGKVEVAGSLYSFSSSEDITGSLSTEQNYIMVTTSSSSITASYTTDVPVWVPSKSGWYDSSTGSLRYMGGCSTDFGNKWVYHKERSIKGLSGGLNDLILGKPGIKIGNGTRSSAGSQVISGIGFQPSIVIFLATDDTQSNMNHSTGFDIVTTRGTMYQFDNGTQASTATIWCIAIRRNVSNLLTAVLASLDIDGFTLTWSLVGSVSIDFTYICLP